MSTRGGGRGSYLGRGNNTNRVKGSNWEEDKEVKPDSEPSLLFPVNELNSPRPLTRLERHQVAHYRCLRDRVHQGPLYTILAANNNVRVGSSSNHASTAAAAAQQRDPFNSMPRYSDKYRKQTRRIPRLDTRPYVLKFFPKELWSTLDPSSHAATNGTSSSSTRKKRLKISTNATFYGLDEDTIGAGEDGNNALARRGPAFLASLAAGDEEEEEGEVNPEDELPEEPEEEDNDYEDDEDDMGGDYNAEQYFDTGGDDAGEDYDGGDGGGEYD